MILAATARRPPPPLQLLEEQLSRILAKCGFRDSEWAGLVELHDFTVGVGGLGGWPGLPARCQPLGSLHMLGGGGARTCPAARSARAHTQEEERLWRRLQVANGALVSLYLAQSGGEGTAYGRMVTGMVRRAEGARRMLPRRPPPPPRGGPAAGGSAADAALPAAAQQGRAGGERCGMAAPALQPRSANVGFPAGGQRAPPSGLARCPGGSAAVAACQPSAPPSVTNDGAGSQATLLPRPSAGRAPGNTLPPSGAATRLRAPSSVHA